MIRISKLSKPYGLSGDRDPDMCETNRPQTWTEVCDRLRLVSRWRIVKSNENFVNYWLINDGMIRIKIYLSSLLLALTSKFHFTKMLITPYILRNFEDWTRHKLKTSFWLNLSFSRSYAVLFLVKNLTSETSLCSCSPKRAPDWTKCNHVGVYGYGDGIGCVCHRFHEVTNP